MGNISLYFETWCCFKIKLCLVLVFVKENLPEAALTYLNFLSAIE